MENPKENIKKVIQDLYEPEDNLYGDFLYKNRDLLHDAKIYFRLFRRTIKSYIREKLEKRFTNILYVTTDCPEYMEQSSRLDSPVFYIEEMKKQYPNNEIRLILPIIGLDSDTKATRKIFLEFNGIHKILERTSIHFNYFAKNEIQEGILYKYLNSDTGLTVWGIYSPLFSYLKNPAEINRFENLVPYLKAVRSAVKKIHKENFPIDIIHSDKIPFFLGAEFEKKLPSGIKVFQTIEDLAEQDEEKCEPFWTIINIADKKTMKRICRDNYIKVCISDLFNIHPANFSGKMHDYLDIIYKNYISFKIYANSGGKNKGEIIFNNLNERVLKMFPNIFVKNEKIYYPMLNSIKNADFYATISKTYYKTMLSDLKMPKPFEEIINKTTEKASYVMPGFNTNIYKTKEGRQVYNNFSAETFREERKENKKILVKEFSLGRLQTNFIDNTLFKDEPNITGYLDGFYEAPLLFANLRANIFAEGIDILFASIIKMLEINKNIQIIISIPQGLQTEYIKTRIDFMRQLESFNGRWVFIDGKINLSKFFAGSDIFLLPQRENHISGEHILAMKFGCVPVVSRTGLLNDTINDIFEDISDGNGFKTKTSLWEESCVEDYYNTLNKALDLYKNNPSGWNVIVKNCLNYNSEYNFKSLEKYNKIYLELS